MARPWVDGSFGVDHGDIEGTLLDLLDGFPLVAAVST